MVKSKLCLDNEKMGDPGRAHRCFNKKTFFIGFYIFMHRHPAPSEAELDLSYYSQSVENYPFGFFENILGLLSKPDEHVQHSEHLRRV